MIAAIKWEHLFLQCVFQMVGQLQRGQSDALDGLRRSAPVDLLCFPEDSPEHFIDDRGHIHLSHRDLDWVRLGD